LLLLPAACFAAREEDRVDFLPGLDEQPEDFDHYAGYLTATNGTKLFYWFVESENDPANDPVVLWLNGGPGCSSLTGFLVELGPWRVLPDGSGVEWFEQRWNKVANIIFLESPACVGYSYNEDGNCASSDDQSALDNHEALKDFFAGWPELAENEFYVTGESYAGVYVPLLSARLVDDPNFNFKGMAIGNGVTNEDTMDNALVPFLWARGLMGSDLYDSLVNSCCENGNSTACKFAENNSPGCRALMLRVFVIAWSSGLNPYNYLDQCYGGAVRDGIGLLGEGDSWVRLVAPGAIPRSTRMYQEYMEYYEKMAADKEVFADIPCTDTSDRETYLNNPEVRAALHVPEFVKPWEPCTTLSYGRQYSDLAPQYLKVLDQGHRVLVFNGDLDIACNHLGDMWFVEDLQQPLQEAYKSWTYTAEDDSRQIAGYVSQYENLVYNQVLGAGHFVPTDKPQPAYDMWLRFIYDLPYDGTPVGSKRSL
jgi:cathepsin A (carboxypeptidase C)